MTSPEKKEKEANGVTFVDFLWEIININIFVCNLKVTERVLFERCKHSRLTVFYKALNNLSVISLDHLLVSSRYTRASNENKFVIASSYWCFQT